MARPVAPFSKVLIANRGEIAVRIARAARALGLRTVAVHSAADQGAPHVRAADEAVSIGPAAAAMSYLSIPRILEAAARSAADAVHPGYGFLAENASFAEACAQAGLVFIGPDPDAIRRMGNKRLAKEVALEAGLPVIPGYAGDDQGDARLVEEARRLGVPLMVKAAAGGGGRGLRRVEDLAGLPAALDLARGEARAAFGDDELMLERAINGARHVEVQVFADRHGTLTHLGERDCSVQRRHQKLIEEAPSPAVGAELRERMGAAAVALAKAIGYIGAGTVEFLLTPDGSYYFLEMNTRIQVEHPVTEMVTGIDLVRWQLEVAAGKPLPSSRSAQPLTGHAVEARLYAEDPGQGFLPQTGTVLTLALPDAELARLDHALAAGLEVSAHYDPLLAKIIAWGETREEAIARLHAALERTVVLGLRTNRDFLKRALRHPTFAAGEAATDFVARHLDELTATGAPAASVIALAAVLLIEDGVDELDGWSSTGALAWPIRLGHGEAEFALWVRPEGGGYHVAWEGQVVAIAMRRGSPGEARYVIDGVDGTARFVVDGTVLWLDAEGAAWRFDERPLASARARADHASLHLTAPMDGRIIAVNAREGDEVAAGQCLVVLEGMKIQHEIRASREARVARVAVTPGDQVAARQVLVEFDAVAAE